MSMAWQPVVSSWCWYFLFLRVWVIIPLLVTVFLVIFIIFTIFITLFLIFLNTTLSLSLTLASWLRWIIWLFVISRWIFLFIFFIIFIIFIAFSLSTLLLFHHSKLTLFLLNNVFNLFNFILLEGTSQFRVFTTSPTFPLLFAEISWRISLVGEGKSGLMWRVIWHIAISSLVANVWLPQVRLRYRIFFILIIDTFIAWIGEFRIILSWSSFFIKDICRSSFWSPFLVEDIRWPSIALALLWRSWPFSFGTSLVWQPVYKTWLFLVRFEVLGS